MEAEPQALILVPGASATFARGRSRRSRSPARAGATDVSQGRGAMPLGPAGSHRAGAVRRGRRAVPDDVLPDLPPPGRRRLAARGSGRGRALEREARRRRRASRRARARDRRAGARPPRPGRRRDREPTTAPRSSSGSAARGTPRRSSASTPTSRSRSRDPGIASASSCSPSFPIAGRDVLHDRAVVTTVASARLQWAEGRGRFVAAVRDAARADTLYRQRDAVLEELHRRVGGVFTLAELAEVYDGAERWLHRRRRRACSPRPDGRGRSRWRATQRSTSTASARRTTSHEQPRSPRTHRAVRPGGGARG